MKPGLSGLTRKKGVQLLRSLLFMLLALAFMSGLLWMLITSPA